uniref:Putative 8.9 kDa family member n=2 Tax=Rhipicephalus microplus TaxID=6941 RepID=A0A6G5A4T7_RHIMP
MKLLSAILLLSAATLISLASEEKRIWPLTITNNNTCLFGQYQIPNGICLDVHRPCVSLCCSAPTSQLIINGCPLPDGFDKKFDGWWYWPNCCVPRRRLPRPKYHPRGLYYGIDGSWRYRYENANSE